MIDGGVKTTDRKATEKQKRLKVDGRGLVDILRAELSDPTVAERVWVWYSQTCSAWPSNVMPMH